MPNDASQTMSISLRDWRATHIAAALHGTVDAWIASQVTPSAIAILAYAIADDMEVVSRLSKEDLLAKAKGIWGM